jgi:uncharacterized protein (TIGR02596 family)
MNKSSASFSRRAFSLMELIVVIAIIAIIAAFTVPQAGQILKGSTLTQGSTILVDQIRLAREYALTKNSKVEVRFYQFADPETPGEVVTNPSTGQFRAMQVFQVVNVTGGGTNSGENTIQGERVLPLDKVQMLPQGVIMELYAPNTTSYGAAYSTLLTCSQIYQGSAEPTGLQLPRGVGANYNYVSFRFLQDGSTNLAQTGTIWYMTLHNFNDTGYLQTTNGGMPYNYFCLQIDPAMGTTKFYRPQAG